MRKIGLLKCSLENNLIRATLFLVAINFLFSFPTSPGIHNTAYAAYWSGKSLKYLLQESLIQT